LIYDVLFLQKPKQGKNILDITVKEQKNIFSALINFITNLLPKFTLITEKCTENNRNVKHHKLQDIDKELLIEENIKVKEEAKKQTSILQNELQKVKYENRKFKQKSKDSKLLIENIPQVEDENLNDLFKKICICIQILIEDTDIIKIVRQPKANNSYSSKISVELNSAQLRNQIINKCKRYKITGKEIGFESSIRIYINPNLIKEVYQLFQYARNNLKNKNGPNFNYVWYTVDGKVLARKSKYSTVFDIKSKIMVDRIVNHPENYN
jgi:hypothetical protein